MKDKWVEVFDGWLLSHYRIRKFTGVCGDVYQIIDHKTNNFIRAEGFKTPAITTLKEAKKIVLSLINEESEAIKKAEG